MALGELQCPSLDYVYRMTWAEFQLRLISFNRMQEDKILIARRLAWVSLIAPNYDPKKLKSMTEERLWSIGNKKFKRVSDKSKERFIEEYKKYLEKAKHNGRA